MATKRKAGQVLTANEFKKRYGSGYASTICLPADKTLWLPSRIPALNYHLGGGLQYGKILEEFGEESTGKSLLALDFAAVCQSLGGLVLWADAEGTFGAHWAEKNGLDLSRTLLLPEENSVEVISDWLADAVITARAELTHNEPILLVIDSIASLDTLENIENSQVDSKAEMGKRASEIDKLLRRRNGLLNKYGVCTLCINQLRQKVGATKWEDPDVTPGGRAMRFYASQRIGLYRSKTIKSSKDKSVGQYVYIRTKKNKLAPPSERIRLEVYFQEYKNQLGYAKYAYLPEILEELGILERRRARWYYQEKMVANGDDAMLQVLKTNPELRQELLKKSGINTASKMRKRLQNTPNNLYPLKIKTQSKDAPEE